MGKTKKFEGSLGAPLEPLEPLEIGQVGDVIDEQRSRERAKEIAAAESELSNAILKAWQKDKWTLSVAVCWIATRGDVSKLNNHSALEASASDLLQAIGETKVVVKGVKAGGEGFPDKVPAECFSDAAPFLADVPDELMFNDNKDPPPYLEWGSLTEVRPELGDGDCIVAMGKTIWKRLTVSRVAIQKLWRGAVVMQPATPKTNSRDGLDGLTPPPKNAATVYQERVKSLICQGVERSSLEEDWAAMQRHSSTITRDRVRDLRKCYAPEAWKKAGRRKSRD